QRLTAPAVDLGRGFARAVLLDVGADHVGAFAGEDQRSGAADAAGGAGDDDGLAGEIVRRLRHGCSPVGKWRRRSCRRARRPASGFAAQRVIGTQEKAPGGWRGPGRIRVQSTNYWPERAPPVLDWADSGAPAGGDGAAPVVLREDAPPEPFSF